MTFTVSFRHGLATALLGAALASCSIGAGADSEPRNCIENMFSTRSPGLGTRAPPWWA